MYAAVIAGQSVLPDGCYVILNGFMIDLGEVPHLYGLCQKLGETSLFFQTLVYLFPCAVFVLVYFAFSVLGASALSVQQALGAVYYGADTAGDIEITLGACAAGFLCQGHAVMSSVVKGVGCRVHGLIRQTRDCLNAQAAGNHDYILGSLRNQALKLFLCLYLVAQKVNLHAACDRFSLLESQLFKCFAIRLVNGLKFLEALVTCNKEQPVLSVQQ